MNRKMIMVVLCCLGFIFMIPSISLGLGLDSPADGAAELIHFEFILPEIGFDAENNLVNLDFLNADMTTQSQKDRYLSRMENQTFKANFLVDAGSQVTIGNLTFHGGLWGGGSINLRDGFTKLFFEGYEPDHTYNLNGTSASALLALSYDVTYARTIPLILNNLEVGATVRVLQGVALYSGEVKNALITTNEWGQAHYQYQIQSIGTNDTGDFHGQGYVADLGVNYVLDQWKLGLAVKNLGPPMEWTGVDVNTEQYEGEIIEIGNPGDPVPISISNQTNTTCLVQIPVVIVGGATYKAGKNLNLLFGLESALSDGYGYSTTMRVFGDVDWTPFKLLRLAGEVSYQGRQIGVDTLTQLRLWVLWLNLELGWTGGLIPDNNTTGFHGSLSTRLRF